MKYSGRRPGAFMPTVWAHQPRVRPFFVCHGVYRRAHEGGIRDMKTDIEIAQSTQLKPIQEIARTA